MDQKFSEFEQKVLNGTTEERWLMKLAAELIKTGQPRACDPLDPDLPGGEEEANCDVISV